MGVTPEESGLCGCWQVLAVERYSEKPHTAQAPSLEIGYYATSLTIDQHDDRAMLALVRQHWSAIENGTHYRRDVTFQEDQCRTANRNAAAVLASLRNLANGLYELEKERKRTTADSLRSWCQQQTFSTVWPILKR